MQNKSKQAMELFVSCSCIVQGAFRLRQSASSNCVCRPHPPTAHITRESLKTDLGRKNNPSAEKMDPTRKKRPVWEREPIGLLVPPLLQGRKHPIGVHRLLQCRCLWVMAILDHGQIMSQLFE